MPRVLSVSELRRALYAAAGGPDAAGPGEPTHALLGTLFHRLFAGLTGPDGASNLVRPLERADADLAAWRAELVDHAYAWHVAPALAEHQSQLHGRTAAVRGFWEAVQELCGWLAELMWEQRRAGRPVAAARAAVFVRHEEDAAAELVDPAWSDAVEIHGRIDAVLRRPATGAHCLVELKTGRSAPEADLAQAILYRMLHGEAEQVAVVGFGPEPREQRLEASRLAEAEAALKALAGRLAGVAPEPPPAAAAPRAARAGGAGEKERKAERRDPDAYAELGRKLEAAFAEFRLPLSIAEPPLVGPTFLRFLGTPGRGVRVGALQTLADSVWTRIRTDQPPHVSIQRGRVTIDVQRPDRQAVRWADLRGRLDPPSRTGCSRFPIGVAVDGGIRWADLAAPENCHFLVAGTSGSGKSEWLRAAIASLLAANRPETLSLLLIDPKRTAFGAFEGAPWLWRPVVYPGDTDVCAVLDALIEEMERRYGLLAGAHAQDVEAYNAGGGEPLRRIVCFCDEYADLIADRRTRRDLEDRIGRLAAKSRAAGIHLVFATQKPSRDVVQGVIDVNLVARIALKVAKPTDSRVILNHPGAATLLGRGDLLFRDLGDPVRLQSPWASDADLAGLLRG